MTIIDAVESTFDESESEKKREQVSKKLIEAIDMVITAAEEGRCFELSDESIANDVSPELFDQLMEAFPSIKMEYDNGQIKIIDVQGQGHRAVISVVSKQFGNFSDLLRTLFSGGGGLAPTYVREEDGSYRKTDKKADPDEALKVFRNQKLIFRVIFEVGIYNSNLGKLDERMKSLLRGWPECLIGIAVKYYPRVLLVYYKRDGIVRLEKVVDVGTIQLSESHQTSLRTISDNIAINIPVSEERCKIVRANNRLDTLETTNSEFYRIKLDSDLLYLGTKFENKEDERPSLILDFLQITEEIHCRDGKMFSGSLQV